MWRGLLPSTSDIPDYEYYANVSTHILARLRSTAKVLAPSTGGIQRCRGQEFTGDLEFRV